MTSRKIRPDEMPAWPRWLNGVMAAAYVGVGWSTFEKEIEAGIWPKRNEKTGRWDRAELDRASDRLSNFPTNEAEAPDIMGRIAQWGQSR